MWSTLGRSWTSACMKTGWCTFRGCAGSAWPVPSDVVSIGDIVTVWVYKIDEQRQRVQLSMVPLNKGDKREKNMKIETGKKFEIEIDGLGTVMDYVEDRFIFVIKDAFWNDIELQMARERSAGNRFCLSL